MTTQATGALSKVVIGFESVAFGTIATAGFDVPFVSSSVQLTRGKSTSPVIRGDFNPTKPFPNNKVVAGTVVVPFDSIASWYWLKAAFNTIATTGASSPWTHVFTNEGVSPLRSSITIEHQYLDLATPQYYQYKGCKVSRMSFSTGTEGELLLNIDIVGQDRTIATSSFDGTATVVEYSPIAQSQATIKEGGTAFADATNVSFDINFNVDTSQYTIAGGGIVGSLPDQIMSVGGNLTALFKDVALATKASANTESSLEITYEAAASSKVIVDINELQYSESDPAIEGPQGIQQGLDFIGYYDDDAGESAVMITLINTEAHA